MEIDMSDSRGWEERFDEMWEISEENSKATDIKTNTKFFIRDLLSRQKREWVGKIESGKYKEDTLDLGAEAIANHAYTDAPKSNKFEAFRFGYNQALTDIINMIEGE